jgi:phosphoglucosamine mutase
VEEELGERYFGTLLGGWRGPRLDGLRIVLDCAHGAAHRLAPRLFESLGAEVVRLGCAPDGRNINRDCGSLHLDALVATVSEGAWAGFAFDGDADRCLAVTPGGAVLDGDYLLYHASLRKRAEGTLAGPVVGTVMSNLGLEQELGREGIPFLRAPVGDRYVLDSLRRHGGVLGGEPSGHILFLDRTTTGDGLLTALAYAAIARDAGGMEALAEGIRPYPQVLRNLRVGRRADLDADGAVRDALAAEEARLDGRGRVVLRFSGTEPLLRLMVEAQDAATVEASLDRLSAFLLDHLGQG